MGRAGVEQEEEEADEVDEAGEADAGMANALLLTDGLWLPSRGFPATEQAGNEDPAANPAAANISPETLLEVLPLLDFWLLSPLAALLELNPLIIFKSLGEEKQEKELDRADLLSTGLAEPPAKSIATFRSCCGCCCCCWKS